MQFAPTVSGPFQRQIDHNIGLSGTLSGTPSGTLSGAEGEPKGSRGEAYLH